MQPKKAGQIDILDGLRGIAVLMVVVFHVWQQSWQSFNFKLFGSVIQLDVIPATGFLGVELFFFISAFCLFYPYARHKYEGLPMQTVKRFAYRRYIKIIPSYIVAMVLMILLDPKINKSPDLFKQIITHVFFVHNYFQDTYGGISGVMWSLAVEVQFYILFPLLVTAFLKWPLRTFSCMSAFSISYRILIQNHTGDQFHYLLNQLPGFLDMFSAGMLCAYALVCLRNKMKNIQKYAPYFTAIAVLMMLVFIQMLIWLYNIRYEPGAIQIWQSQNRRYLALIFLVLTLSSALSYSFWRNLLANRVLVYLSLISYNLYLWHQFIALYMKDNKVPPYKIPDPSKSSFPMQDQLWQFQYTLYAIVFGIVVAALISRYIERPLLKLGFKGVFSDLKAKFKRFFRFLY